MAVTIYDQKDVQMSFEMTPDFSALQRQMKEANEFGKALEQVKAQPDLLDPGNVQAALREIDQAIDRAAGRYPNNKIVKAAADKAKEVMHQALEEKVREAQQKA